MEHICLVSEDKKGTVIHGGETCNIQIKEGRMQTSNTFAYFSIVSDYLAD